jgi:hypothetical protein
MRFTGQRAAPAIAVLALSVGLVGAAEPEPRHLDRPLILAPGQALAPSPLPIVEGDVWAYKKGTAEPPANWATLSFNDASWLHGPSGFGFGATTTRRCSGMVDGYSAVYTRRLFTAGPVSIGGPAAVDYDDGFIWPQRHRVARRRWGDRLVGAPRCAGDG